MKYQLEMEEFPIDYFDNEADLIDRINTNLNSRLKNVLDVMVPGDSLNINIIVKTQ